MKGKFVKLPWQEKESQSYMISRSDLNIYIKPIYEALNEIKGQLKEIKGVEPRIIKINDISKEEAKSRIKNLFDNHPKDNIYPSEISEELHINYDLVLEIVKELINENEIEIIE